MHDKRADDEPFRQALWFVERGERRTEFRQEGGEHGPARDRQTQSCAGRGGGGTAPRDLTCFRGAVGGKSRVKGTHQYCGDPSARDATSPCDFGILATSLFVGAIVGCVDTITSFAGAKLQGETTIEERFTRHVCPAR